MSTTPDPAEDGPRLRARARAGKAPAPELRPEVAEALGGLERSIDEVAAWERELAGPVEDPATDEADAEPAAVPPVVVAPRRTLRADPATVGATGIPPRPDEDARGLALPSSMVAGDLAPEPDLDLGPLLADADPEQDPLAAWDGTPVVPVVTPTLAEARRRRNGRVLSWAGAVLLVAVAAFWFIPDRGDDGGSTTTSTTPTTELTVTTRDLIDGPVLTAPTTIALPTTTTLAPTTTVRRRTTTTTARPATTTTTVRATTTTTAPTTTTTRRIVTTTTTQPTPCTTAVGDEPDPSHPTC